jgi:hypothetical protein
MLGWLTELLFRDKNIFLWNLIDNI